MTPWDRTKQKTGGKESKKRYKKQVQMQSPTSQCSEIP